MLSWSWGCEAAQGVRLERALGRTCGASRPGSGKGALWPRDAAPTGTWEVRSSGHRGCAQAPISVESSRGTE